MKKRSIDDVLADVALEAEAEPADADDEFVPSRVAPRGPAQVYSVRIPVEHLDRLRRLAELRGVAPTALVRDWVVERLAAEAATEVPVRLGVVRREGASDEAFSAFRRFVVHQGGTLLDQPDGLEVEFVVAAGDDGEGLATAVERFNRARRALGPARDTVGLAYASVPGSLGRAAAVRPRPDVDVAAVLDAVRDTLNSVLAGTTE